MTKYVGCYAAIVITTQNSMTLCYPQYVLKYCSNSEILLLLCQQNLSPASQSHAEMEELKAVMFLLICFFPVVLGVVQYISWSQFTIRRKIIERHIIPEENH